MKTVTDRLQSASDKLGNESAGGVEVPWVL